MALAALALPTTLPAADIHLAPDGDDRAGGQAPAQAVATLARAVSLALEQPGANRILVAPGLYRGQGVVIDGRRLGQGLTIMGTASDPREYPRFIGDGGATTWLMLRASDGRETGLVIEGLRIANYLTAISLNGNRDDPAGFNSGTIIRRNIFNAIGSIAVQGDVLGTAAVRLVNARNSRIEDNYFNGIRNRTLAQCGAMHPVYLAHFASGNRIVGNSFQNICGSAIKLRDRSSHNHIVGNRFVEVERAPAIEEWYCDKAERADCTKQLGECPSIGNVQSDNEFRGIPKARRVVVRGGRTVRDWCPADAYRAGRIETGVRTGRKPFRFGQVGQ